MQPIRECLAAGGTATSAGTERVMVADYCIRRLRLSSRDTNAIGTAYSCLACHSCRSHSRADHSIRCGHILMRSMDTVPGCMNSGWRNCLRNRLLPAALIGEDIASRSSMKEYLQSERARCSPVTTSHKEFTTCTLSIMDGRTFPALCDRGTGAA